MFSVNQKRRLELPPPQDKEVYGAKHPFKDTASHQKLLDYVLQRLLSGKDYRDSALGRYVQIDREISGWMKLDSEDRKRELATRNDGIPRAVKMNLPVTFVHLDDMMTYFAEIFAPNGAMFYMTGQPDEMQVGQGVLQLMNNHAEKGAYYRQTIRTLWSCLKYNLGGFLARWEVERGVRLGDAVNGEVNLENDQIIWQGNCVESLDMYNTLWDPSVNPIEMHTKGEFFAKAELISHFTYTKMKAEGMLRGTPEIDDDVNATGMVETKFYIHPPTESFLNEQLSVDGTDQGGQTNWMQTLSLGAGRTDMEGFELVTVYIRLNPTQHNLVPRNKIAGAERNRLEIWELKLLNGKYIVSAAQYSPAHNQLPCQFGMINDDTMEVSQKSPAEIIRPLAQFASFLLNTHVAATRKNIWGLIIYDADVIDLANIPEGEVAARVKARPGTGKDISRAIWEHNSTLETKQTMQDLNGVMGMINQFFPTQSLPNQVASIDRAVDSQVAAVVQGANRRMKKAATLLDNAMFRPLRNQLYFNILQNEVSTPQVNDRYGRPVTVDLSALRSTDLPFILGQGLKAIDRLAIASKLQEIIFAIVQNPAVAEQIDLLGLIDYWTSMLDVDLDMRQFHIQNAQAQGLPTIQPPDTGEEQVVA